MPFIGSGPLWTGEVDKPAYMCTLLKIMIALKVSPFCGSFYRIFHRRKKNAALTGGHMFYSLTTSVSMDVVCL